MYNERRERWVQGYFLLQINVHRSFVWARRYDCQSINAISLLTLDDGDSPPAAIRRMFWPDLRLEIAHDHIDCRAGRCSDGWSALPNDRDVEHQRTVRLALGWHALHARQSNIRWSMLVATLFLFCKKKREHSG